MLDIGPGWQRRAPTDAPYSAVAAEVAAREAAAREALPEGIPQKMQNPAKKGGVERPPRRLSVELMMDMLPGKQTGMSMYDFVDGGEQ